MERRPSPAAIALWLAFVALAVSALALTGTKALKAGAIGESARRLCARDDIDGGGTEGRIRRAQLIAVQVREFTRRRRGPVCVQAVNGARPAVETSADGHSVLVVVPIGRLVYYNALKTAPLAAGAAHPGVTIKETSEISAQNALDTTVNRDLHRAELLSFPVTLISRCEPSHSTARVAVCVRDLPRYAR